MTGTSCVRTGALTLLAACFFVSGLLRAGEVVAALPGGEGAAQEAGAGEQALTPQPDVVGIATELRRQREALQKREAELEERARVLEAVEARLRERLAELTAAREKLASTAALVEDAAVKDVRQLAEMYRKMKPREAGQIFNAMAPEFAAGFLAELGPDSAGPILASMEPDKAYAVSLLLAGRNLRHE